MTVSLLVATIVVAGLIGAALWARADFKRWTALGPGGLPHTTAGWIKLARYRLMSGDCFSTRMYSAGSTDDSPAHLGSLPRRAGPRPRIAPYPIPHRQLDQYGGTQIRRRLDHLFDEVVERHAGIIHYKLSHFEKHTPAITLCKPECGHDHALASHGEVAHVHPFDGSMHMIFSPRDAKVVIEAGWGERHPLAGRVLNIPNTYIFVYPPRDDEELAVVGRLIDGSVAHMRGVSEAS
jgi:hypothetical protein